MSMWVLIGLQWLHVLGGIFWFGSALFGLSVLAPVLQSLPAEMQRAVTGPLAAATDRVIIPAAVMTILLGAIRGIAAGVLFQLGTPYGITWLAALLIGVGLIVWALAVTGPATRTLRQLEPGPAYAAALRRAIVVGLVELATFFVLFSLMIAMRFGY